MEKNIKDAGNTSDNEHGCRKGRSCLCNLLLFWYKVSSGLDKGKAFNLVIYLDFAKTFYMVAYNHLIHKLKTMKVESSIVYVHE